MMFRGKKFSRKLIAKIFSVKLIPFCCIGSFLTSPLVLPTLTNAKSIELQAENNTAENYISHPMFIKMLDELEKEHDFDRLKIIELFQSVKRQDAILEAMSRPAEKTKTWSEYKPIFVNSTGVKKGLAFWQKHQATFEKAAEQFQVPEAILVAIIGVETRYGTYMGRHKIIESLATLAFDYPPRSAFFYKELKHYLVLTRQLGWDPLTIKGSYAGAMGYGQFISSSYLNLAIDFDNDGKTDLINNPVDAIGSVANYFNHHQWKAGEPVLVPAKATLDPLPESAVSILNRPLEPKTTLQVAAKNGLIPDYDFKQEHLVRPFTFITEGKTDYYFGLHNFFAITEYNHSKLYARAVFELALEIESSMNKTHGVTPSVPLNVES